MQKEINASNTLIYTVNIDTYDLDVEKEIVENIVDSIKENIKEYSILKNVKVLQEDDTINVYSGKSSKDPLIYSIVEQKKDSIISIFVYEVKQSPDTKIKVEDEKEYFKTLFSVVWKSIDNVKEEIEADLKHRIVKIKDEIPDDTFKSDIKISRIYEYLMNEVGKKNSSNYNKLSVTIDEMFANEYRGIDDLVKIVYKLYKDYSKEDNNTLYYAFIYVFEDFKRRDTVLDDLFYSGNLENHIKKTDSYIETEKYLKDVITRIYKDFRNGLYEKYVDVKGKKEFIVFVTDIVHEYHKMFCNMYEIPIKKECRDIDTVINYILKDHTNITIEDYKKIKKWADTILVDDGTMQFQKDLLSNLSTMYLKNDKKDIWNVDKTELALVTRYDEIMLKNKYDEKIFPIYSLLNFAKGCNSLTEYEDNTKKELEKIDKLDVTDTMKNVIKSVTVIYHYIFLYQYGLDVGEEKEVKLITEVEEPKVVKETKSILESISDEIKETKSIIDDIDLDNYIPKAKDEDIKIDIDLDNPLDLDFDFDDDDDDDNEIIIDKPVIEKTINEDKKLDLDLDLDFDFDEEDEDDLTINVEKEDEDESLVEEIKENIENITEDIKEAKEDLVEEIKEEKKYTINTTNNLEYELVEEKEKYIMNIILPGLKKSEVEVDYEYNKIIVTTAETSDSKCSLIDKYYNNVLEQALENVDEDGIDASLKSGILTIVIPKKITSKKKITIK